MFDRQQSRRLNPWPCDKTEKRLLRDGKGQSACQTGAGRPGPPPAGRKDATDSNIPANGSRCVGARMRVVSKNCICRARCPPHSEGPPLHVHFAEAERGEVISGILSATLDGKRLQIEAGGRASFPIGSAPRWWNDGDKELMFQGVATPAVDLDRYLQALFEVLNAGPERRRRCLTCPPSPSAHATGFGHPAPGSTRALSHPHFARVNARQIPWD